MPEPIKTVNELSLHAELFDPKYESQLPYSDMAAVYLGVPKTAAKKTYSDHTIGLLKAIHNNEDELLTATNIVTSQSSDKIFRAPKSVSDYDLLHLKTEGLISGNGRAVKFTPAAQVVLRDHWLKSSNNLLNNRKKTEFVHPSRNASVEVPTRKAVAKFSLAHETEEIISMETHQPNQTAKTPVSICGYCGKPGADTRPDHIGNRLPNANDPGSEFIHLNCEFADNERAAEELRKRMRPHQFQELMSTFASNKKKFRRVQS